MYLTAYFVHRVHRVLTYKYNCKTTTTLNLNFNRTKTEHAYHTPILFSEEYVSRILF